MLFILTGDIRTGKTTWLEARVQELAAAGVSVQGVLAPGVWRDGEKVGIENVLLPSRKRVLLATPSPRHPQTYAKPDRAGALTRRRLPM